jgi:transposase-like protein
MVSITLTCLHCGSDQLVRNGHAANDKQRYKCRACGRQSRASPAPNGYSDLRRAEILGAYQERSSLGGLERTFGVSRNTVTAWLKKGGSRSSPEHNSAATRSKRPRCDNAGTGRTLVVRTQESACDLDLDRVMSRDTTGCRLCGRRSK